MNHNLKIGKKYMSEAECAEMLSCSVAKLQRDRCLYGHDEDYLPWIKINGSVRYPIAEVERWLDDRMKR